MERLRIQREYQLELLSAGLKRFFGDFDEHLLQGVLPHMEWMEAASGEVIFRAGDVGDDLFFLVSGRLRATVDDGQGGERLLGEIMRGESIGEMSVVTGAPRSATITALRTSVLVRLRRRQFQHLLAEFPRISMRLMQLIIERLDRSSRAHPMRPRPGNIVLLPISGGVDAREVANQLAARLASLGRVLVITPERVVEQFGAATAHAGRDRMEEHLTLTRWMDEQESHHDFLVLAAEARDCGWTRRCLTHADEVLLLASTSESPIPSPLETALLAPADTVSRAGRRLLLFHRADCQAPQRTAAWLDGRDLIGHVHLRQGRAADLDRLARIVGGTATGLVLSGGGARGFAHLGVYRALQEAGIDVDYVGGTSMGAVIGGFVAMDVPAREAIEIMRDVFKVRPLGDFNVFPLISLISGKRMESQLQQASARVTGGDRDMEDCWKSFYCVASSYSHAREVVIRRGPLNKMLRASLSIPGFFPPVYHNGEALIDGAIFNNFPTDVMARQGVGRMIGVDLGDDNFGPVSGDEIPGPWKFLRHWLGLDAERPKAPMIGGMLFHAPMLYSKSRQEHSAEVVDLLIRPDLRDVRMLDWKALDRVVEIAYRHTRERLAR